ncbi:MAG: PEP-CTERM sorting domain-containing protein [Gallionellaceae bacterium]|nr:PEP-CTERM sorting domain-containing protein [Gallionellaceae bacterium]
MTTIPKVLAAALLCLGLTPLAQATVTGTTTLTFDDIFSADPWVPDDAVADLAPVYGGLQWDSRIKLINQDYYLGTGDTNYSGAGYHTGVVSGDWAIYNIDASAVSFYDTAAFTFMSADVTRATSDGSVSFYGYRNGVQTESMVVNATTSGPTLVNFNWTNVDKVTFSSDGSDAVLDNITVSAVPEPETYAMLMAGLGMMGFVARRRRSLSAR